MKLKIKELCEERGVKSAYELAKKSKLNMPTAYRAYANDIKQFTIETLEALCAALNCSPNDIFGVESPRRLPVNSSQSPAVRVSSEKRESVQALPELAEGDRWLTSDEVAAEMGTHPSNFARDYKDLPSQKFGRKRFIKLSDFEGYKLARR